MVVERYRRQVGETGLPRARVRHADVPNAGAPVAALGQMAGAVGQVVETKMFERAKLDATNAGNAYQRALTAYLYDPDAGVLHTRMRGDAAAAAADFDGFADRSRDEIAARLSGRAKEMFAAMSEDMRAPFWRSAAAHEAREMEGFRVDSNRAVLEGCTEAVRLDPKNEALCQVLLARARLAVEELNPGASEEALRSEYAKVASGLEEARLTRIAEDDVIGGMAEIEKSTLLTEEARGRLRGQYAGDVERIENQGIVDGLIEKHGYENEFAAKQDIRERYEGEREQALLTLHGQRVSEYEQASNRLEKEQKEAQKKRTDDALLFIAAGGRVDLAAELAKVQTGEQTMEGYNRLLRATDDAGNRAKVEKSVRAQNPNMSPQEQENETMFRLTGKTPAQIDETARMTKQLALSGELGEVEIEDMRLRGFVTNAAAAELKDIAKNFGKEQRAVYQAQKSKLGGEVGEIVKQMKLDGFTRQIVIDRFAEEVAKIDPKLPAEQYGKAVEMARVATVQSLLGGIDAGEYDGVKMTDSAKAYSDRLRELTGAREEDADASPPAHPVETLIAGQLNRGLLSKIEGTRGVGYKMGAKDLSKGKVDCSGLVSSVYGDVMRETNRANGVEVFDKEARGALGGASADIIRNVAKKTGVLIPNPTTAQVGEGWLLGLDASAARAGGSGYKGIDHIAMVVRHPRTGNLLVYESNAASGVTTEPLQTYLQRYRRRKTAVYAVNPALMARGTEASARVANVEKLATADAEEAGRNPLVLPGARKKQGVELGKIGRLDVPKDVRPGGEIFFGGARDETGPRPKEKSVRPKGRNGG